jgi:hypothetical protein
MLRRKERKSTCFRSLVWLRSAPVQNDRYSKEEDDRLTEKLFSPDNFLKIWSARQAEMSRVMEIEGIPDVERDWKAREDLVKREGAWLPLRTARAKNRIPADSVRSRRRTL